MLINLFVVHSQAEPISLINALKSPAHKAWCHTEALLSLSSRNEDSACQYTEYTMHDPRLIG